MQWHDLLGAVLIDFFDGSPYVVETEVDLSLKKQYLDIVVIRRTDGEFHRALPDGLSPLAKYNLISFKSHQDTFDSWSMLELIGHYVNYRKQSSPSRDQLLSEEQFGLFGITTRFPESLAKQVRLEESQAGVYDIHVGSLRVRLLVIRDLPDQPANAMFKLFSIVPEQIEYACQHYRPMSRRTTGIVDQMIRMYRKEDERMASTLEELNQKILKEALESASVKDRLKGLTTEQRLEGLPLEEIVKALPTEKRLKGLSAEEIVKALPTEEIVKALPTEKRLTGLSAEEIEAYLRELKKAKPKGN